MDVGWIPMDIQWMYASRSNYLLDWKNLTSIDDWNGSVEKIQHCNTRKSEILTGFVNWEFGLSIWVLYFWSMGFLSPFVKIRFYEGNPLFPSHFVRVCGVFCVCIERKREEGSKGLKIQSILEGFIASSLVMNSRIIVFFIKSYFELH